MSGMFEESRFNGDLSRWNTSSVRDMSRMFKMSDFNGDISQWDVSSVTNMSDMFYDWNVEIVSISKDSEDWDLYCDSDCDSVTIKLPLNFDISRWNVSRVQDMSRMFYNSQFNGDISRWNVSSVRDMKSMFSDSMFNGDLSRWNVSSVRDMKRMFSISPFNGDLSRWDVSSVRDMNSMFQVSDFNGDISQWDVSSVRYMDRMFNRSQFDQNISRWDIRQASTEEMFLESPFRGDIDPGPPKRIVYPFISSNCPLPGCQPDADDEICRRLLKQYPPGKIATLECELCGVPLCDDDSSDKELDVVPCGHAFHSECLSEHETDQCPVCGEPFLSDQK
jgi:surface protein